MTSLSMWPKALKKQQGHLTHSGTYPSCDSLNVKTSTEDLALKLAC